MHKYSIARKVPKMKWVVLLPLIWKPNVAQHWDMLAIKLRTDEKDPLLWENSRRRISMLMEVLTKKWLLGTSSVF